MTAAEREAAIVSELHDVIPNAVHGAFHLDQSHIDRLPSQARESLAPYVHWGVFVFGVPITDDGLWVWHHHGRHRSLLANYVLSKATEAIQRRLASFGERALDLPGLTHDGPGVEADLSIQSRESRVSMTELGELAGLGTRGWNNLLLHPKYGAWLQIHAVLVQDALPPSERLAEDVCTECGLCLVACPVDALSATSFSYARCQEVVAAPWLRQSRAQALTATTYVECRECISSCPIGGPPEGIFEWKRSR